MATSRGMTAVRGLGPIVAILVLGLAVSSVAFVMARRSDDQRAAIRLEA